MISFDRKRQKSAPKENGLQNQQEQKSASKENELQNQHERTRDWVERTGSIVPPSDESDSESESLIYPALTREIQRQPVKKCKFHCCKFCGKMNTKMSTHMIRRHKIEPEVSKILTLKKGTKERRAGFIKLQDEGDFKHNYSVLRNNEGDLIPKYRFKNGPKHRNAYLACQHCKGLFLKSLLFKHNRTCSQKPENTRPPKRGECAAQANLLLPVPLGMTSSFFQSVISKMRDDDVSRIIRNDSLMIKYGERLFSRTDIEEHSAGHISSRLRELGRLCILLQQESKMTVSTLQQGIDPMNFDILVACVKTMAQFNKGTNMLKKGTVALNLGYSLKKCNMIMKAEAIKSDDSELLGKCDRFQALYEGDWYDRVSSCASQSVLREKMNKPKLLPSLEDVEKVNDAIERDSQSDSYGCLAKATSASITIFNRKRGGEVQRMKYKDYIECNNGANKNLEQTILADLTPVERKLAETLRRVEIRGKFNRPVPILLTPMMSSSINKMLVMRSLLGIDSRYLFVTKTGERPYRGSAVLKEYATKAEVSDSSLFTATALRKQLATLSQALELSKLSQDQIATFLGHDIRVHRAIYRQPMEIMQKSKVASILLKVNRGIHVESEDFLNNEEDLEFDDEQKETNPDESESEDGESEPNEGEEEMEQVLDDDSDKSEYETPELQNVDKPSTSRSFSQSSSTSKSCLPFSQLSSKDKGKSPHCKGQRKKTVKRPWQEKEISAVHKYLSQCLVLNKVPRKEEAELAIRSAPNALGNRSWREVKFFVYNLLKKKRTQ